MKRWIHASSDSYMRTDGWEESYNEEGGYDVYKKDLGNGYEAILRTFNNDGDWGINAGILYKGDWVEEKTFEYKGSLERAKKWAENFNIEGSTCVKASEEDYPLDTYVVKIWHEVDDMRKGLPSAAEEIFMIDDRSPDAAIEQAKRQWDGPIDRIEIVDINPDPNEYEEIPFEASTCVEGATDSVLGQLESLVYEASVMCKKGELDCDEAEDWIINYMEDYGYEEGKDFLVDDVEKEMESYKWGIPVDEFEGQPTVEDLRKVKTSSVVEASSDDFFSWYDSLSSKMQAKVDDLADEWGLPYYEDCSDIELSSLHDAIVSK